jgi:hypothetical protein
MARLDCVFDKFGWEGRDPQLFCMGGTWLFPLIGVTGGIKTDQICFLIGRGEGDRAPRFEGDFPFMNHHIYEIGRGWRVIAVRIPYGTDANGLEKLLQEAEDILRKAVN